MLKQAEYNEFVEKLAEEIVNDAIAEKLEDEEKKDNTDTEEKEQKRDKDTEDDTKDEEDKEAEEYIIAAIQKAAAVFEDADAMEKAANNVLEEAQVYKEAAIKIFNDYGLLDD
jgi:hypothetical protein